MYPYNLTPKEWKEILEITTNKINMKKTKVGQEVKIKKFISRKLPKTEIPYDLIFDGRTRTGSKIKTLSKVLNVLLMILSATAIAYLFINVFSVAW